MLPFDVSLYAGMTLQRRITLWPSLSTSYYVTTTKPSCYVTYYLRHGLSTEPLLKRRGPGVITSGPTGRVFELMRQFHPLPGIRPGELADSDSTVRGSLCQCLAEVPDTDRARVQLAQDSASVVAKPKRRVALQPMQDGQSLRVAR